MSVSFDKKLAELDAYLQMLIVEHESLDKKLSVLSSSSSSSLQNIAAHDSEREGILKIRSNLEALISSIKHAIVLLQIAKVSSKNTEEGRTRDFRPRQAHRSRPPLPSTPPPTRPIRSTRHTSSFGSGSRASGSQSSSIEFSDSCNSQNSEISDKKLNIKYGSCPQASESRAAAGSNPQLESTRVSPAPGTLQSGGFAAQQQYQAAETATADAGSLSRSASSTIGESRHHNRSSEKNVVVNLSDASARGGLGEAHDEDHYGAGLPSGRRENDADEIDEDDEDAFYDAPDEQLPKPISSYSNQPIAPTATNTLALQSIGNEEGNRESVINLSPTTDIESLQISISTMNPSPPFSSQPTASGINEPNNNNGTAIGDGSIDWDAMYEDEEEEELDSMEGQGSVIKHLLSQIRIGMDLTKVVLPTFILERRSLLEMYADFFAHPDLFSAIPDSPTPEARMIQLVKWYLSAFHAGRRSSVAKKPYNPILGEIFRCDWDLPDDSSRSSRNNSRSERSVSGQLTFVAEQVSHHPPVSAFYAENKEKNISCCAHIYTKSKYLGLSVGVINVGQGVINLHKHNETYVCTFPDAFGRSILTVPWVELGGSVSITCQQTRYTAKIEFLTKPFYGGKKHRVTGDISSPNNEPIMAIDGEWNGIMYSRSPPSSSRKDVFVDTTNLPVIKKHVKSIGAQETFESRNVWKEVTRALKIRDVNSATAAKTYIEQRQRDLLKERQEKGAKWKTRFFEPTEGDGWRYSRPLGSSSEPSMHEIKTIQ